MKLRTKLVVWFLLVAVLPLAGIVLYSYVASQKALRQVAVVEAGALTAEIGTRLENVRDRVGVGVRALGELPIRSLVSAPAEPGEELRIISRVETAMGDAAPFVQSLEFIPSPPEVEPFVIFLGEGEPEAMAGAGRALSGGTELALEWLATEEGRDLLQDLGERMEDVSELVLEGDDSAGEEIKLALETVTRHEEFRKALQVHDKERRRYIKEHGRLEDAELELVKARTAETARILGREFDCAVESGGKEIGRLRAQISAKRVLLAVLDQARRDQGEIPFAIDADGEVYVAAPGDLEQLADLPLEEEWTSDGDVERSDMGDWVVVRSKDAESDLVYGIARPLHQSLRDLRRTTGRNFAWGLGLVGLALVGIAPMSRRITRDLSDLTLGAELLAAGDLDTRVPVRTADEVGQLALAFNNMAEELCENQRKLLEEERLRKEQELERRLLETEHARKTAELEEARRFQLSLLPKSLPEHPELDVAVYMATATEVGGDYYDFHQADGGDLTVAIGDATGHGAKAGTMVTVIKSLFTAYGAAVEPHAFLTAAGESIRRMELGRMAMALSLVRFSGGTMKVAAAGMPPVFVGRTADGSVQEVTVEGVPLGSMTSYDYREAEVGLERGDTVLLMSDGFPELADEAGEPLGYGRVRDLFEGCVSKEPQEIIDELAAAARERTPGEAPGDDVTFVVVRRR